MDQFLHLSQIILIAISVALVWVQLRINNRLHRRNLYVATTEVSEDYYKTCLFHWKDHFAPETYQQVYKDRPVRCKSFLLMKRKYMYLVFQNAKDEFGKAADRWLEELVQYREFVDVHEFNGHYYDKFSLKVAKYLKPGPKEWLCDDVEPY